MRHILQKNRVLPISTFHPQLSERLCGLQEENNGNINDVEGYKGNTKLLGVDQLMAINQLRFRLSDFTLFSPPPFPILYTLSATLYNYFFLYLSFLSGNQIISALLFDAESVVFGWFWLGRGQAKQTQVPEVRLSRHQRAATATWHSIIMIERKVIQRYYFHFTGLCFTGKDILTSIKRERQWKQVYHEYKMVIKSCPRPTFPSSVSWLALSADKWEYA